MDTNKMREQFEAWYLGKFCGGSDRVKRCSNADEVYYYTDTQDKWVAWQASREAVVVELPDTVANTGTLTSGAVLSYKRECREAIEAQGLKVAP